MKELVADLWTCGGIHAITTNGFVKNNGDAVMGAGCAREAMIRYPGLPATLGRRLKKYGNHLFYFEANNLITFPVKDVWWREASVELIARSAIELDTWIQETDSKVTVYLPRPGCGNGKLTWNMVKPVIEPVLSDQVIVVSKPGGPRNRTSGWENEHGL